MREASRKLLEASGKLLESFQKLPEAFGKLPESFWKASGSFWKLPESFRKASGKFPESFRIPEGSGKVPEPSPERAPPPRVDLRSPYPVEVKPRGVRWVKSHEWTLAADREWTESQRREMRWLLHEATARGVRLQPSDFVAMFPSFDSAAIRRAAVEELTTLHAHPPPKPLVWMSQMIVDESGELRSKHDRPH